MGTSLQTLTKCNLFLSRLTEIDTPTFTNWLLQSTTTNLPKARLCSRWLLTLTRWTWLPSRVNSNAVLTVTTRWLITRLPPNRFQRIPNCQLVYTMEEQGVSTISTISKMFSRRSTSHRRIKLHPTFSQQVPTTNFSLEIREMTEMRPYPIRLSCLVKLRPLTRTTTVSSRLTNRFRIRPLTTSLPSQWVLSKLSSNREKQAKMLKTFQVRLPKNLKLNYWRCCILLVSKSLWIKAFKDRQPWNCKEMKKPITCNQELWTLSSSNCWGGEVVIKRKALNTLFRNTKFV